VPVEDEEPPPSSSATTDLGLGEVIAGKYRVDRMLGAGGMGVVVAATHLELQQPVAIKMLRAEGLADAGARARFAREARAAVRLKSQHVARVIDVGTLGNGVPYLVMEYLEGSDLATVIEERGGLPIATAVSHLLQICEAVAEAHGLGIVHRDLKPRNVFVTTGVDGKPLLKVLDFGISKIVHTGGTTGDDLKLTKTTDVMGSPSYMSPEQMRAARDADERSDIWALGVILFESITGRLPWEATTVTELGAMVLRDAPPLMRDLRPDIPPDLEQIVFTCLEKDPARRFASVEELAHALEPHASGLASGAAERIASVARTSRRPAEGPSGPDNPSTSSSRVMISGGTSVSWGETEPMAPAKAPANGGRSRPGIIALAVVAVVGLAAGGYALGTHKTTASAPPPQNVLPLDRGGVRPPPEPSGASPSPLATPATTVATAMTTDTPAASASAAPAPSAPAIPVASIPRRAPGAAATGPGHGAAAPPSEPGKRAPSGPPAPAAPPAAADPHDLGSIGRK